MSTTSNPASTATTTTSPNSSFTIVPAHTPADLAAISILFRAYADWLAIDLSFQGFAAELAGLPEKYAAPTGALLLARDARTHDALGCIALRPLAPPSPTDTGGRHGKEARRACELKRLYTTPAARGRGVGQALVRAALEAAGREGYEEAMLDTLPEMGAARALYRSEGFEVVGRYYETPIEETIFMAKRL